MVPYEIRPSVQTITRKVSGSYYTPLKVARSLVDWAARRRSDLLLDPSCGDGAFLGFHRRVFGVERDAEAIAEAGARNPWARLHHGDYFEWAESSHLRFDGAVGNPPFIRYQVFSGATRDRALSMCRSLGIEFTRLSSSWAPFLAVTASLLKRGGRMAFVVPAEIGHAPYARPLLRYLLDSFEHVQITAVREKMFPKLSEDCWLLRAEGFGQRADGLSMLALDRFEPGEEDQVGDWISRSDLEQWGWRLRPFLLSRASREAYLLAISAGGALRLGDVARVSIGYVTGDNDFFHLRPSQAARLGVEARELHPTVRNGRVLDGSAVTMRTVRSWQDRDEPMMLLRLEKATRPSRGVLEYINSEAGQRARMTYKCRTRDPWYVVPDVRVPDAFLTYMSGTSPSLVANQAGCACTNSVHAVHLRESFTLGWLLDRWKSPITLLSCELEGHPLGGGMLKLEPREAAQIVLVPRCHGLGVGAVLDGISRLRRWRHHD